MKKVEVFDPAMCCATGVCGPSIDPELIRIATIINALKEKGVDITRYGLSSDPQAFVANKTVNELLEKAGADVLPVTLVNGTVVKTKVYPTTEELVEWLGVDIKAVQPDKGENGGCCCGSKGCC